jgi:hypothetical protein
VVCRSACTRIRRIPLRCGRSALTLIFPRQKTPAHIGEDGETSCIPGEREHSGRAKLAVYGSVSSWASAVGDAVERKADVFEAADIREWRGHDVVDPDGHKIGELEAIYVDTSTDQPAFGTVKVGMPTRHRLAFVPLAGAIVGPGYIQSPTIGNKSRIPLRSPPTVNCLQPTKRPSSSTTACPTRQEPAVNGSSPAAEQYN